MKTNFLFIFLFINSTVFAQQQTGIYKTAEDYRIGKPSFNSTSTKVKLHHFFSKNYVDVMSDEKTIRFCKDSIFGYHNANGDFRFYKNNEKEFKILEAKSIVIYSAEIIIPSSNRKRMEVQTQYFFSKNLSSTIFPLTVLNLKKAFADNLKLHDALEMEFSKSTSIATYDSNQKMYRVNFLLLSLSNNQN